jgi:hypothetical protein
MDTKTLPDARLDGLDAERFRDMLASPPFAWLWARIVNEFERSREECTKPGLPADVSFTQGRNAAYRAVLAIPKTMLDEMSPKRPDPKRRP